MKVTDGREIRSRHEMMADVVVVGSGPAGASVARELSRQGARVVVVEEGQWHRPEQFAADSLTAMTSLYRSTGASVTRSLPTIPFVQGCAVGGTSVINGAISWRLPRDVHEDWCQRDPALRDALPWEEVAQALDEVERDLNIRPTPREIQGPNDRLLAAGAEALGLSHRPIRRNVRGCEGLGRCLQGCPEGHKLSMDRSFLPDAVARGAEIVSGARVEHIDHTRGRAVGVRATTRGGGELRVRAEAVVLAASAVHTPLLLWKSRIRQGPVGENFMAHPGVSVSGRFAEPVRLWSGSTQGHEVIGLREEGIKFESLGYDIAMAATRLNGVGSELTDQLSELAHWANWGAAIRAKARGRVRPGWGGSPRLTYSLATQDLHKLRRAVSVMGRMMYAAGAEEVCPKVHGWREHFDSPEDALRFEAEGPVDPWAYQVVVTHMFGTCRMGSDPATSVVRPDFRHHTIDGLWIADSSVFPSNTGVNPQTSIIALATLCARGIAREVRPYVSPASSRRKSV